MTRRKIKGAKEEGTRKRERGTERESGKGGRGEEKLRWRGGRTEVSKEDIQKPTYTRETFPTCVSNFDEAKKHVNLVLFSRGVSPFA